MKSFLSLVVMIAVCLLSESAFAIAPAQAPAAPAQAPAAKHTQAPAQKGACENGACGEGLFGRGGLGSRERVFFRGRVRGWFRGC